jgi:hypothetical protein
MGSLMVDFVKAFDSIEHLFIRESMKFFGFGETLIGMVGTLLTDRRACIDLGTGHGEYFQIARGAPQGDRSSPYIFIICIEVLILKLECDDTGLIRGIERRVGDHQRAGLGDGLLEAFADDLTVQFIWSLLALGRIFVILDEFGSISGLVINKAKTNLMISGKEWEGGESALGIKIVASCKLLGVKIDSKIKKLDENWAEVLRKVWGLIHYWNQYRLSLTGRVMVAKTFLMSQTTFLMGILPVEKRKLVDIENAICQYACGNLKIARDKVHNRVEQGGLGLIKLEELDTAIKCGWINRWCKEGVKVDFTGKYVLSLGLGDAEHLDLRKHRKGTLPCAEGIINAWTAFRKKFYENESNIYEAEIFGNPGILSSVGQQLETTIFHGDRVRILGEIRNVKLNVLLNERGTIKEKVTLEPLIPGLSRSEFLRLKAEVNWLIRKYKPRLEMRETAKNVKQFMAEIKKGSSKFRAKISGRGSQIYSNFECSQIKSVKTLWEQMDLEIDEKLVSIGFTLWKNQFLDLSLREFLFKMSHGLVHGNTVISHFGNVDRKCTFCKIKKIEELVINLGRDPDHDERALAFLTIPDENRPHIFWECPTVMVTVTFVLDKLWGIQVPEKKTFLMGKVGQNMELSSIFQLVNLFIRYKIWNYKLAGILPKPGMIVHETERLISEIFKKPDLRGQQPLLRQLALGPV